MTGEPMAAAPGAPPSPIGRGRFACPRCGGALTEASVRWLQCPADGSRYERLDGIWRFLLPERAAALAPFIRDYETIRLAEGRSSPDAAYYRALPYAPAGTPRADDWAIRARSFDCFVANVLRPLEGAAGSLVIADLGAGNGWLSYRMASRGHLAFAVDLTVNAADGLGAWRHYDAAFTPVQAEFNHLPLPDGSTDLVIFNASLHYSTGYEATLAEAARILRPGGSLVVVDTPVYRDPGAGEAMVAERAAAFRRQYGFASDALPSENYLTPERLAQLETALGIRWEWHWADPSWRREARGWRRRLAGLREAAQFPLLVASR